MKLKNLNKWHIRDKSIESNISEEELTILDKMDKDYKHEEFDPKNEDDMFEAWKMIGGLGLINA